MRPEDRDAALLWDMLQAARDAVGIITNITRESFLDDRVRMLALERSLELIGEAARRVSDVFREKHPQLPWKEMIGLRNISPTTTGGSTTTSSTPRRRRKSLSS